VLERGKYVVNSKIINEKRHMFFLVFRIVDIIIVEISIELKLNSVCDQFKRKYL